MSRAWIACLAGVLPTLLCAAPAAAEERLGTVRFRVTCSEAVQPAFVARL